MGNPESLKKSKIEKGTLENKESQPALKQKGVSSPGQGTVPKSRLQCFTNCTNEDELHLVANFQSDIMLHVFAICPRKDDLGDLCTMCSENLFFDSANRSDATSQSDLEKMPQNSAWRMLFKEQYLTSPVIAIFVGTHAPVSNETKAQVYMDSKTIETQ